MRKALFEKMEKESIKISKSLGVWENLSDKNNIRFLILVDDQSSLSAIYVDSLTNFSFASYDVKEAKEMLSEGLEDDETVCFREFKFLPKTIWLKNKWDSEKEGIVAYAATLSD